MTIFLLPEIFLGCWILILLIYAVIFSKFHTGQYKQLFLLTDIVISLLAFTLILLTYLYSQIPEKIYISSFTVDSFNLLAKIILVFTTLIILIYSKDRAIIEKKVIVEFPILILLACLGFLLLVSSNEFLLFYLSLELISLTSYVLASLNNKSEYSTEAGLKYFILGSFNSAILLLGIGILYSLTGETNFTELSTYISLASDDKLALQVGASILIVGVLFKLAAAPYHYWAIDVYDGSSTIITAFFTIVPKLAIWYILWVFYTGVFAGINLTVLVQFSIISSLIIGSIAGLNQTKLKRLLAYSAISHIGMILLGILPGTFMSIESSFFYVLVYIIISINVFGILLSLFPNSRIYVTELAGLSRIHPTLAATLSLSLFCLAGIPPLAGFFSKYLVLVAAIDSHYLFISLFAIVTSVISGFYYLRIIKWIYFKDTDDFLFRTIGGSGEFRLSERNTLIISSSFYIILTLIVNPNFILTTILESLLNTLV